MDGLEQKTMASKTVAIFDFDGTLVKGDSFWPFLVAVAGWTKAVSALVRSFWAYYFHNPQKEELRTFIKSELLRRLLKGVEVKDLAPAIGKLKDWVRELPTAEVLRQHYAQGHYVIIASGSLDLYLPALLSSFPHHALICTEIGVENNVITGVMTEGNCVRQRKAERIADYLSSFEPFAMSWGYGNYPHDIPMLNLVQRRVLV